MKTLNAELSITEGKILFTTESANHNVQCSVEDFEKLAILSRWTAKTFGDVFIKLSSNEFEIKEGIVSFKNLDSMLEDHFNNEDNFSEF